MRPLSPPASQNGSFPTCARNARQLVVSQSSQRARTSSVSSHLAQIKSTTALRPGPGVCHRALILPSEL